MARDGRHRQCDEELLLTGRKKELIVASNGKKIYPARIEGLFKREPLISHVLLIGDKLPFVTALITVTGDVATAAPIVERTVKEVNKQLPSFEQIRKFKILDRDFSIESGELTPTMKMRKSRILENHRALVNELYAGREFSLAECIPHGSREPQRRRSRGQRSSVDFFERRAGSRHRAAGRCGQGH